MLPAREEERTRAASEAAAEQKRQRLLTEMDKMFLPGGQARASWRAEVGTWVGRAGMDSYVDNLGRRVFS